MKNPLTLKVESWVGSAIVLIFSIFLVGIFILAVKNFGSDTEILAVSDTKMKIRTISEEEKTLIDSWLVKKDTGVSVKEVGYRFIVKRYPDRPWLEQ